MEFMRITRFLTTALMITAGIASAADINSKDFSADDLFQLKKVWTIDLVLNGPRNGKP